MSRFWNCLLPALALSLGWGSRDASGQCLLANPSFELPGSGNTVFRGWNQFGSCGFSTNATHGSRAARVSGPNSGGWGVSGYWQRFDTAPGERWAASIQVSHDPDKPLAGQSRAILNIEWRNSNGDLLSYESHTAADPAVPPGEFRSVSVESQPAPPGTAATHFLLGALQGPGDPSPEVLYDQATFDNLGPPTLDELQWSDFPGGRTIQFSGRTWRVKGPGYYGPGPNLFCDDPSCLWVDANGHLHLTVQNFGVQWYSTEAALVEPLGYGDYIFTTVGRLDALDPQVVLGLFLWQYGRCWDPAFLWWNPYNEIDIEFSRWGSPGNDIGQFVAQPFDYPGNLSRFDADFVNGEITSHAFRWRSDRVEFRSWRGGPQDEAPGTLIHAWTYTGPHIPRPEQPRVHVNLWRNGQPPAANQEVVLEAFTFVPPVSAEVAPTLSLASRCVAVPNPFRTGTTIRLTLPGPGPAKVDIFDLSGRLVRSLRDDDHAAGTRELVWDGRDDDGTTVASGLYFARIRAGEMTETRRLAFVR